MTNRRGLILVVSFLLAATVLAGTRARESRGTSPTLASDGIALTDVKSCRVMVYEDGGTLNTGGKIVLSYYGTAVGWVQSDSALTCTVVATTVDGGTRTGYVCPDLDVLNPVGRIAAQSYGIVWSDGGVPKTRLECYGPALP